jgi:hypothetical protein
MGGMQAVGPDRTGWEVVFARASNSVRIFSTGLEAWRGSVLDGYSGEKHRSIGADDAEGAILESGLFLPGSRPSDCTDGDAHLPAPVLLSPPEQAVGV